MGRRLDWKSSPASIIVVVAGTGVGDVCIRISLGDVITCSVSRSLENYVLKE